jgi:hypothetical protein
MQLDLAGVTGDLGFLVDLFEHVVVINDVAPRHAERAKVEVIVRAVTGHDEHLLLVRQRGEEHWFLPGAVYGHSLSVFTRSRTRRGR